MAKDNRTMLNGMLVANQTGDLTRGPAPNWLGKIRTTLKNIT